MTTGCQPRGIATRGGPEVVRQAGVDAGSRPGVTSEESTELKREKVELQEARQSSRRHRPSSRPNSTSHSAARGLDRRALDEALRRCRLRTRRTTAS
jgi:hypothetical protein